MLMDMVQVGRVRVAVPRRFMRMPVAVCAYRYWIMGVGMVSVIMGVGVFMLQCLMFVLVFMPLYDVEHDTRHHQHRAA